MILEILKPTWLDMKFVYNCTVLKSREWVTRSLFLLQNTGTNVCIWQASGDAFSHFIQLRILNLVWPEKLNFWINFVYKVHFTINNWRLDTQEISSLLFSLIMWSSIICHSSLRVFYYIWRTFVITFV